MAPPEGSEPDQKAEPPATPPPAQDDRTPVEGPTGGGPSADVPDAGTVPQPEPTAAAAPMTDKAPQEKAASESPPSETGTPPAEVAASTEAPTGATPAPSAKPAAERPARPAREAEPKEAPRVAPPAGSINETLAAAAGVTPKAAYMVPELRGESVAIDVSRDDLTAVMTAARDELGLTYLRDLCGVDWQEQGLEVVYHLSSLETKQKLTVKTRVSYDDANVPSVTALYPAADWHERETRDMFGINFEGHPNLVPILLPEDMTDHFPLRKDNPLQEIEEWQGDNLREGAGEGDE